MKVLKFSVPVLCLLVSGCAASFDGATSGAPLPGTAGEELSLTGSLHGGQQPISGARVYLLSAGTSGYGSASTSLLTSGDGSDSIGIYVNSLADGSFNLTGKYTCTANAPVYVLASGGSPVPGVTNNAASRLMTVLGACPSTGNFSTSPYAIPSISIDELTTTAAAYAMAPFAVDALHVGTSGSTTSIAGLNNAMQSAMQIVSSYYSQPVSTTTAAVAGYGSGLSANGTIPASTINSVADILASCVNSNGTGYSCTQLMSNAKSSAGTIPTDVATAAINIAQHPGANVSNLYALVLTTAPFQPSLASAPNDWTLSVAYTAPNNATPTRGAVDASGNFWYPNYGNSTITELSPLGVVLSGASGMTSSTMGNPYGLAINPSTNQVFVANSTSNYISVFIPPGSGVWQYGTFLNANVTFYSMAFDSAGNAYMGSNSGVYTIGSLGTISRVLGTSTGTIYTAALNSSKAIYGVANAASSLLDASSSWTGGGLNAPTGIAVDGSNNFWIANSGNNSLSEFGTVNSTFKAISGTGGFTGGGLSAPWGVAVDGVGNVFASNTNGTISQFNASGIATSGSGGYGTGSTGAIYNVSVDSSGNVWAPDTDGKIYKFIGLAAPVATPLSNVTAGIRP